MGEKDFSQFLNSEIQTKPNEKQTKNELSKSVEHLLFEFSKTSGTGKDPAEKELKKRRKKKK